jgi:hypothetical protein
MMPAGHHAGTVARARTVARPRALSGPSGGSTWSGPRAEQVKPRDAVFAAGGGQRRERRVEVGNRVGVDGQQRAAYGAQPDPCPQDHPGQPHPADRRGKPIAIPGGFKLEHLVA